MARLNFIFTEHELILNDSKIIFASQKKKKLEKVNIKF